MPRPTPAMTMTQLRDVALTVSRGLCACCGAPLGDRWELHHRRPGGMGGTRRVGQQMPANVLALRPLCHNLHPRSVHLDQQRGRAGGWLVSTHADPALVPVLLWGRQLVLLDDQGGYTRVADPAVA